MLYAYYAEEGEEVYWEKGIDMFTNVEIDGINVSVETLDAAEGKYQLSNGEHTVKYTLKDPTFIGTELDENDNLIRVSIDFNNCTSIVSVEIPDSVTGIGGSTFYGCTGLTSVTIPSTVTSIDGGAFYGCSSLTSVTIPNSVTTIGLAAFGDCTSLTSVTISNSVTSIDYGTFSGCTSLISVIIPDSVTSIDINAFSYCSSLSSVTIGSGVTSINNYAFNNCSSLDIITLLVTIAPTITNNTFQDVKINGTLTVPAGATGYDTWMGTGNYYLGKYNWTIVEQ